MTKVSGLSLLYMDSSRTNIPHDDSTAPRIVRNIERISNRYREYLKSEISEEQENQVEQAEKVKKLRKKEDKAAKESAAQ